MNLECFSAGASILHRVDVRLKLISAFFFSVVVALCHSLRAPLIALLVAAVFVFVARLPMLKVVRRLFMVNLFTLLFWLTLPLTVPGELLIKLGPLVISRPGVDLAGLITLKTNAIVLAFLALVATSGVADIGHALASLKLPNRFCMLLLFTYRYIFVLQQEYQRLRRAALLRGFKPMTSMHTYQTYGNLLGMTLVKSWQRGIRVQQAMVLRGFQGKFYTLESRSPMAADWSLFALIFLVAVGIALMESLSTAGGW
ncbi:MAG: cobalt ECF transporter T component CbiQ [Thermodesulfobacteriota bacterium]